MLEQPINVLQMLQGLGENLVADVAPEDFCQQPVPGINHPAWTLGHLAYATDRHTTLLGCEQQHASWKERFSKGSTPVDDPSRYPSKDELLAAWRSANDRLIAAVQAATADDLAQPNEYLPNPALPTLADFLTFSMTSHTSLHVGQLSAWRRAMGRKPLF